MCQLPGLGAHRDKELSEETGKFRRNYVRKSFPTTNCAGEEYGNIMVSMPGNFVASVSSVLKDPIGSIFIDKKVCIFFF